MQVARGSRRSLEIRQWNNFNESSGALLLRAFRSFSFSPHVSFYRRCYSINNQRRVINLIACFNSNRRCGYCFRILLNFRFSMESFPRCRRWFRRFCVTDRLHCSIVFISSSRFISFDSFFWKFFLYPSCFLFSFLGWNVSKVITRYFYLIKVI